MPTHIDDMEYTLIFDRSSAKKALAHIRSIDTWALDFETTSLSPKDGKVRLTSVSNGEHNYLFDHENCGSFKELARLFVGPVFIAFMATFELRWFQDAGADDITLWDVGFMRKAKLGGGPLSLAIMADRDLNVKMEKDLQTSDWSQTTLTEAQMRYATYDALLTWELFEYWDAELTDEQFKGFHVINDVLAANVEMEETGLYLDTTHHYRNIKVWERKRATAKRYFEKWTPVSVIANINSNAQVSDFLKRELSAADLQHWPVTGKTKHLQMTRSITTRAANRLPYPMNRWMAAFVVYRFWNKYLTTYGEKFITIQNMRGKITSRFNIAAAKTGRYSSSSQNLQNIPRKPYIRKAFCASPKGGDVMALADYTSVEVRVLAELSGDKKLLEDAIYGNMHGSMAAVAAGINEENFLSVLDDKSNPLNSRYKAMRSAAKPGTFRITYGAGVGAVADSIKKSDEEAAKFVDEWSKRYPKAYGYRKIIYDDMMIDGFIPVVDGRTIYVVKNDRTMPVAANYPIQGAAASVMYRAIYHTHRLYIERDVDALLAATVHDELLSYSAKAYAERALECKIEGMTQGWLDIFPGTNTDNLLDYAIGTSWADKP